MLYYFGATASQALATRNFTTVFAGICIAAQIYGFLSLSLIQFLGRRPPSNSDFKCGPIIGEQVKAPARMRKYKGDFFTTIEERLYRTPITPHLPNGWLIRIRDPLRVVGGRWSFVQKTKRHSMT